jgi:hypothetical protein
MEYYYNDEGLEQVCNITKRILQGRRVVGHFIEADMESLVALGLDLQPFFDVPESPEEYAKAWANKQACGFDTGRAIHAIDESADFSLKAQARLHTAEGRYDKVLDDWIADHTSTSNPPPKGKQYLDGYGIIPDDLLYPYGCYDADVTRQLALVYGENLNCDMYGNDCWQPFWIAMRALPAVLEINCQGLLLDTDRLQQLTESYQQKTETLLQEIRAWARWDTFNPKSCFQMRELLFGEQYNGKLWTDSALARWHKDNPELSEAGFEPPKHIRLRPDGAKSMGLTPIMTTGKYPRKWEKVQQDKEEHLYAPSTNKNVLAQLYYFQNHRLVQYEGQTYRLNYAPALQKLRQLNVIGQTLRYVLKPPQERTTSNEIDNDDIDSDFVYDGGIPSFIVN